jgi:hypothetical protein
MPSFLVICLDGFQCTAPETTLPSGHDQLVHFGQGQLGQSIGPQQFDSLRFDLQSNQAVEPGSHLIIVTPTLQWLEGGQKRTGNLTASTPVSASILGESQILTLLTIPTVFLLPGFIVVVVFYLLWQFVSPHEELEFLKIADIRFWGISAAISGFAYLVVYPRTPIGTRVIHNVYSLSDDALIFLGSAVVGVLAYLLTRATVGAWERRYVPTPADSPIDVLRKIGNNDDFVSKALRREDPSGGALHRRLVQASIDGQARQALEVYRDLDQAQTWVAPPISLRELRNVIPQDFKSKLLRALDDSSASKAAGVLEEGRRKGHIEARWKSNAVPSITGPTQVATSSVIQRGTERRIVERGPN